MSIYKGSQFIAGTPDLSEYAKSSDITSAINTLDSTVVKLSGNQTIAGTKTFSSAVKCAGSATTGTAITTSAISKSANGYVKLGNGIIIQWGKTSSNNNVTVTFPTAFTSTPTLSTSVVRSAGDSYAPVIVSISATNFKIYCGGGSNGSPSYWIAIGY